LGWKTLSAARRDGLRTVAVGRRRYVVGRDVVAWLAAAAREGDA